MFLCIVLPDDGLQTRPKHVALLILLCLMERNSFLKCNSIMGWFLPRFVDSVVYSSNGQLQYCWSIPNCHSSFFQNQFARFYRFHNQPCCAGQTGSIVNTVVLSIVFERSAPFSDALQIHCAIIVHLYQLAMNLAGRNTKIETHFFAVPSFQRCCHCTSTYPLNSIWP
jgi:hypothetical protein